MFRKATLLAAAVTVIVATAVPATASAIWSKTAFGGSVEHLKEKTPIQATGQAIFHGGVGTVECQVVANAQLIASTTTGSSQFDVDNGGQANDHEKCSVSGALTTLGCTDVEQVTVSGSFEVHALSTTILEITTGTIQNHLTGGPLCPKTLQLTPGAVYLQTAQDWWEQGQLSGTLKLHSSAGEDQVTITGAISISPAKTYGVT